MTRGTHTRSLVTWVAASVAGLAALGGIALLPPSSRASIGVSRADAAPSWRAQTSRVDGLLAVGDVRGAVRAGHEAYAVALGSRRWDAMLAVGDAFMRIGQHKGSSADSRPSARHAYLIALTRAEAQNSADGVLSVATAFAALDDR